jgi:hypothetical protein
MTEGGEQEEEEEERARGERARSAGATTRVVPTAHGYQNCDL